MNDKRTHAQNRIRTLLSQVADGRLDPESALAELDGVQELSHTTIDTVRAEICGLPEVVYGEHKSAAQVADIVAAFRERDCPVLVTRLDADKAAVTCERVPESIYHPESRLLTAPGPGGPTLQGRIGVVTAGTSDLPVAGEARLTLEFLGYEVSSFTDIGVAGLHRLLRRLDQLREQDLLIVVAGMEGALPSVVAGQVACPVIAVPTSVGYGANLGGLTAMLGMLTSCAAGVTVVNIDAGFSAACAAARILRSHQQG